MVDGHSSHSVMAAGGTAECTHCDPGTDYNNLGYGREVVGWPSLERRGMRWRSERMAEHIMCSPES